MAKLTKVQQTVLDTLLTKKDARIRGSYKTGKWALIYTDGGFTPSIKVAGSTLDRLFTDGYITLGEEMSAGDSGLTIFRPTASRVDMDKVKAKKDENEDENENENEDEQD